MAARKTQMRWACSKNHLGHKQWLSRDGRFTITTDGWSRYSLDHKIGFRENRVGYYSSLGAAKSKAGVLRIDASSGARRASYGDMTRKDFAALAKSLSEIKSPAKRRAETNAWIPRLKAVNPRFDAARFRAAVEAGVGSGNAGHKPPSDSTWLHFVAPGHWKSYRGHPKGLKSTGQFIKIDGRDLPMYSGRAGLFLRTGYAGASRAKRRTPKRNSRGRFTRRG